MVLRAVVDVRLAAGRLAPDLPAPTRVGAALALRGVALRAAGLRLDAAALLVVARFGVALGADVFLAWDFFTVDFLSLLTVALRAVGRFDAAALRAAGRFDATALRAAGRFDGAPLCAADLRGDAFDALALRAAVAGALRLRVAALLLARLAAFLTAVRFAGLDLDAAARDCLDLAAFGLAALVLATVFAPHVTTVVLQCAATDGSLSAGGQLL